MAKKVTEIWKEEEVRGERLDFETNKEDWNVYKVEDGTTVQLKTVVAGITRLEVYKEDGEPIYIVKFGSIVQSEDIPKKFMKPTD